MNKKRKGNRKTIMALALSFCMLFGTMLTAQAKDYNWVDILDLMRNDSSILQTGDRILADPDEDITLHYGKFLTYDAEINTWYDYEETDRVTVKAGSEGVEVLKGTWNVWKVSDPDIYIEAFSDENSNDERGSTRKSSHTSSYERGLNMQRRKRL